MKIIPKPFDNKNGSHLSKTQGRSATGKGTLEV
jgi:hypothetical protein